MHVHLFEPGADPGPRPAWQVIEAARRRYLTGLLVLDTTPVTHVYLRDGQVYFAERTTDGGLAVRLMVEGVITRAQMQQATLQVSGVDHLGRMFERDSSIDRDAVELCVELMTDDVLTAVAETPVTNWSMQLYQRHPSGLDRWLPTRVEVITHLVGPADAVDPAATVSPAPVRSHVQLTPPPATGEVKVQTHEPTPAAEPIATDPAPAAPPTDAPVLDVERAHQADDHHVTRAAHEPAVHSEPTDHVDHVDHVVADRPTNGDTMPATTFEMPVFRMPLFESAPTIEQPATDPVEPLLDTPAYSFSSWQDTPAAPAAESPIEEAPLVGLAPSAMEALMSTSIKDEVAEAVRRALAQIDSP